MGLGQGELNKVQMIVFFFFIFHKSLKTAILFQKFSAGNLRLEECRMLGITDYFATITDDGKPGEYIYIHTMEVQDIQTY